MSTSNRCPDKEQRREWTFTENVAFDTALRMYNEKTPDRWHKVVACVPWKTLRDVIDHYAELHGELYNIEAGTVPLVHYEAKTNSDRPTSKNRETPKEKEEHRRVSFTKLYGDAFKVETTPRYDF